MHRRPLSLIALLLTLAIPSLVSPRGLFAEEGDAADSPPAGQERIWNGYLWRDDEGRVQMGWPVVAMGVMAQPAHTFEAAFAERLSPWVSSTKDTYVFWNYALEEKRAAELPHLPRVLLTIQGHVAVDESAGRGSFGGGPRTMRAARVKRVEFVSDAWLDHWSVVFRETHSPWRIRERPQADPATYMPALARKILAALTSMKAVPGPSDAQRKEAARIAPEAEVVTTFRRQTEEGLLRWLHEVQAEHGLDLPGLDALGKPAPSGRQLQAMFMDAESRAAFFEALKASWSGDVDALALAYYLQEGNRIRWASAEIAEVRTWTDETFAKHRDLTRKTMGWQAPGR